MSTTPTTNVGLVPAIAQIAERKLMWVHVDSGDARSAMICPEFRWAFAGCDGAHALIVNPHKWLFTPMGTSVFSTRRPEVLRRRSRWCASACRQAKAVARST
jgi:aromatic-L-amino-acid decarboxylase